MRMWGVQFACTLVNDVTPTFEK
jgi:hypothetical protein